MPCLGDPGHRRDLERSIGRPDGRDHECGGYPGGRATHRLDGAGIRSSGCHPQGRDAVPDPRPFVELAGEVSYSQVTPSPGEPSAGRPAESSASTGKGREAAGDLTPVKVCNPLLEGPYRTGSYLIYDFPGENQCPGPSPGKDNFRCGLELRPHPCRASGSHQLDYPDLLNVLDGKIPKPTSPGETFFLVDLRKRRRAGFLGDRAVSWYADNDFSNVGYPPGWIREEEEVSIGLDEEVLARCCLCVAQDPSDNRAQRRMLPTGYRIVPVKTARTEEEAFQGLKLDKFTVKYVRIPVTDHGAPPDAAITNLRALANEVTANDWVHFHCHGGDGRTTTFLALYSMWCWEKALAQATLLSNSLRATSTDCFRTA